MSVVDGVRVAVPFFWLGAVLAISFLEAPLKFRAPGITVPLGLGIGRLVFRALNLMELALAVVLVVVVVVGSPVDRAAGGVLTALVGVLVVQTVLLRTRLDRRARQLLADESPPPAEPANRAPPAEPANRAPPSRLHLVYVLLEVAKAGLLVALGVVLMAGLAS